MRYTRIIQTVKDSLPTSLKVGELICTKDTYELFIGTGENQPIIKVHSKELDEVFKKLDEVIDHCTGGNASQNHSHSNKVDVLDKLSVDNKGRLLFKGLPIELEGLVDDTITTTSTTWSSSKLAHDIASIPKGDKGEKGDKGDTPSISHLEDAVEDTLEDIEERFNSLSAQQQQDAEVIDARNGKPSLKARIDEIITEYKDDEIELEFPDVHNEVCEARNGKSSLKTRIDGIVTDYTDTSITVDFPSIHQDVKNLEKDVSGITNTEIPKLQDQIANIKPTGIFDNLAITNTPTEISNFNFVCIDTNRAGVPSHEMWILCNAYYDKETQRFKRVSLDNFSFGWQFQASGTYPGEEGFGDYINQGVNLWKANGRKAFPVGSEFYTAITEDIGVYVDGKWQEFGYVLGWNNHFMNDSYGGMTIGGSGFEIDGSGLHPFSRVSHGIYRGGSREHTDIKDYDFAYTGTIVNSFHGLVNKDANYEGGFFYGLKSAMKDVEPRTFVDHTTTYFTMMLHRAFAEEVVEEWHEYVKINPNGTLEIDPVNDEYPFVAQILGAEKTDYQILFDYRIPINKDNALVKYAICTRENDEKVKVPLEGTPTISDSGIHGWIGHDEKGVPFKHVEVFVVDKNKSKDVEIKHAKSNATIILGENGDIHFNTEGKLYFNGKEITV